MTKYCDWKGGTQVCRECSWTAWEAKQKSVRHLRREPTITAPDASIGSDSSYLSNPDALKRACYLNRSA